jgi:hypothetical protein
VGRNFASTAIYNFLPFLIKRTDIESPSALYKKLKYMQMNIYCNVTVTRNKKKVSTVKKAGLFGKDLVRSHI